jgi:CelD/BcsL family acetyltransferase involved in cellulose biosynthesis
MALEAADFVCDVIRPSELGADDKQGWYELCAGHVSYGTPLLQPCFSDITAQNRGDVRLALYRRDGRLVGVFAYHLRPNRFARPVGVPFSDFAGPVLARDSGLTPGLILQLAGLRSYKFSGVSDPWGVFSQLGLQPDDAYQIDLTGTEPAAYLEACRSAHPKRFKNFRRQISQVERRGIKLDLTGGPPSEEDFRLLTAWKSAQFRRTGRVDLVEKPLTSKLLHAANAYVSDEVRGYMVRLTGNGELLAGHFGLRSQTRFHPWLAAFRTDFAPMSPGSMILYKIIQEMPKLGLQVYELAGGHDYYKKYFARSQQATLSGTIQIVQGSQVRTTEGTSSGTYDNSAKARLRRRLDHIAVCETRPLMRVVDVANAVISTPLSRSGPHED